MCLSAHGCTVCGKNVVGGAAFVTLGAKCIGIKVYSYLSRPFYRACHIECQYLVFVASDQ